MRRIVCVGNRYFGDDDAGPRVFDHLTNQGVPKDVDLVDGGVGGLNLLWAFDRAEVVVVVDSVRGFGTAGTVHEISSVEVAAMSDGAFDHASGLPYLLRMLPAACASRPPAVCVIGVEIPADDESIAAASVRALEVVGNDPTDKFFTEPGAA